jgi:hypothetical protein
MDGHVERLREEFSEGLRRLAELKVQLDLASGVVPAAGVPHYSLIEDAAHEAGQLVSREIQRGHMRELGTRWVGTASCPACRRRCETNVTKRTVTSGDGPVELQELTAHCPSCRRAFFPSAGSIGL